MLRSRLLTSATLIAAAALALAGCSAPAESASTDETSASTDAAWPREITHAAGETTIDEAPLRIVSTSPSITGSLLAIDAPIIGTGAALVTAITDDKGFFTQWAKVADERGVEVVYADITLDLDAVDAAEPDLIIGSANGGDSTLDAYDQLSEIAPTVLLDYGTMTWQELTTELGDILGLEDEAAGVISDYDTFVAEKADEITVPAQPSTVLMYLGADGVWAYGAASPQADLLTSLGFTYQAAEASGTKTGANGVDIVTAENMPSALAESATIFTISMSTADPVATFVADPLLVNQKAVAAGTVFDLGHEAFRLDYYSAKNTVEHLVATFGK